MAHKQPSNSNNVQVPSWDEFNLVQDETNSNRLSANGFENDQQEIGPIYEPAHAEEFGPNLPPGFVLGELQQEDSVSVGMNCDGANDDFSIPIEAYDLDDPEDPLQGGAAAQKKPNNLEVHNQPLVLPKVVHQKSDEQCSLPSLSISSGQLADFVPVDQRPCSSSTIFQCDDEKTFGPALPPEFVSITPQQFDEYDIGTSLPPDEPQCSMDLAKKVPEGTNTHRKQKPILERTNFGPTLPSSSDEEEEEKKEDKAEDVGNEHFGKGEGTDERRHGVGWEEGEEETIGPMPPMPGKTEEEEHAEYLGRLTEFEFNKHTQSKELRREEWMTELPQKMLKTGAFGLTAKTSFSRRSSDLSLQQSDLWTNVPNGNSATTKPKKEKPGEGSSTKTAENERLEQQKVDELNKERGESLLERHQKKRKIENAQSSSKSLIVTEGGERKPFDRDREIESRCFRGKGGAGGSGEMKERMGGELSSRFGHANDRKFL
ncbi:hypothetical protein niasHT_009988 [Heterodera trifolii]|uniref:DUF3752 domain-containing protein n=1 Tax=Heterodera trifolii TaxID=157864 RepID=A0ABD2MAN3_9BILA